MEKPNITEISWYLFSTILQERKQKEQKDREFGRIGDTGDGGIKKI